MSNSNIVVHNVVFDLPYVLMLSVLENWLSVCDLCKIDTAVLCHKYREVFLQSLRNPNTLFHGPGAKTRVDMYHYQEWVKIRCVKVRRYLNIKGGYKFVCKKLPSLCDVVGSVDNSKSRSDKTGQAIGGVFNYTADSIECIINAMKLPDNGMRFLDAGCGNAIFLTLIRISFPTAEIVGLDLQPVINTLQSIQTYCNYDPFKSMRLLALDINIPPFKALMDSFQPTHAACIIGLPQEETSFLEAVRDTPSVVCIAIAEQRNPAQDTDFDAYGFEQTNRVAVHLAGSRKKRYVLIATRKTIS